MKTSFNSQFKKKSNNKGIFSPFASGFTFVEMIVVIAIFLIITGIVLANYKKLSTGATVGSTAQDIALSLRKSQQYALGFRSPELQNQTDSIGGFGMRFGGNFSSTDAKKFILFADFNQTATAGSNNHVYDGSSCGTVSMGNECVEQLSIATADKITSVCMSNNGTSASNMTNCLASNQALLVTFTRPNPDAYLCYQTNGGTCTATISASSISDATVTISSIDGTTKKVTIWNTGQISVK